MGKVLSALLLLLAFKLYAQDMTLEEYEDSLEDTEDSQDYTVDVVYPDTYNDYNDN